MESDPMGTGGLVLCYGHYYLASGLPPLNGPGRSGDVDKNEHGNARKCKEMRENARTCMDRDRINLIGTNPCRSWLPAVDVMPFFKV